METHIYSCSSTTETSGHRRRPITRFQEFRHLNNLRHLCHCRHQNTQNDVFIHSPDSKPANIRKRLGQVECAQRQQIDECSQLVICHDIDKHNILLALHDNGGHRGRDATMKKVLERYLWRNLYQDVENYVKSCDSCQRRQNVRVEEELHPNLTSAMWL